MAKRDDFTGWTIRGFHWDCSDDGSICVYGFSIAEESVAGSPKNPFFCHFVIHGGDDTSAVRNPFINVPCEEIDNYRCSGSWSDNGYMVFTVDDIEDSRRGYFDIPDSELENGRCSTTHHSHAYVVLPSAVSESVIRPHVHIHTRDDVPSIADYDIATDDFSDESTDAEDDAFDGPKQYTVYEDNSHVYTIEGVEIPADASQPTTSIADIDLNNNSSNLSTPIEAATQDAVTQDPDVTAVSSDVKIDAQGNGEPGEISPQIQETAAVDTPVDTPADASVAASVDTSEALPQTVQDAIPEQLASVQGNDGANSQSITANPVSSSPIPSDGLPTVPESPITWSLRNVTRGTVWPFPSLQSYSIEY